MLSGWDLHPAPFAEGDPSLSLLLRAAGNLSCLSPGRALALTYADRAVVAAALLSALRLPDRLVLAAAPDQRSREALKEHLPLLRILSGQDPETDLTQIARGLHGAPECDGKLTLPDRGSQEEVWVRLLTGGSTGPAKLVAKTRSNLLGEVALWHGRFAITPDDVVLATVSPLHIYGLIHSVLVPLLGGCRAVRCTPFLPGEVDVLARRHGATILVSAPAHLHAIRVGQVRLPHVRLVLSSGSHLPESTAVELEKRLKVPVVEIYGSTESGAIACRCRAMGDHGFVPLPQVQCRLKGESLRVRSPFLSPDLALDGEGYYVMPDRVTPLEDGGFELLGRRDDLVKIAGKRVDLSDLERRVRALAGVEDVTVQAVPSQGSRGADIGVVVVSTMAHEQVRLLVNGALSAIVRPRWIRPVEAIPRTETGKVDLAAALALFRPPPTLDP